MPKFKRLWPQRAAIGGLSCVLTMVSLALLPLLSEHFAWRLNDMQAYAQGNSGGNGNGNGNRGRGNGGNRAERAAERALEEEVEARIDKKVAKGLERRLAAQAQERVDENVKEQVEKSVGKAVAAAAEKDNVSDHLPGAADAPIPAPTGPDGSENSNGNSEQARAAAFGQTRKNVRVEQVMESRIAFEIDHDNEGFARVRNRWLIMTDASSLAALRAQGYDIAKVDELEGLGSVMAEVVEPKEGNLAQARRAHFEIISHQLTVDYDHLYQSNGDSSVPTNTSGKVSGSASENADGPLEQEQEEVQRLPDPHSWLQLPQRGRQSVKIGVLDSAVDTSHPVFNKARVKTADFAEGEGSRPLGHGTATTSIMVGQDKAFRGLLPQATIFSASVFFDDARVGQRATVKSLVLALNWLAQADVDVVNVSLTGPENQVLGAALKKLVEKGVVVVAAVGNAGPSSRPLYPAAYDFVVAVTATNEQEVAYHLANRGMHVDIAAPGVLIKHAGPGAGYVLSSGTSYAAPFVSAYFAARLASGSRRDRQALLDSLYAGAKDLGPAGKDEIYGHGLVQSF